MDTFFYTKEYLNGNLMASSAKSNLKSWPMYKTQSCLILTVVDFLCSECI